MLNRATRRSNTKKLMRQQKRRLKYNIETYTDYDTKEEKTRTRYPIKKMKNSEKEAWQAGEKMHRGFTR